MAREVIDLGEFYALSANYRSVIVRLSPDSLTLLLCTYPFVSPFFRWRGAAGPTDETEQNAIDAIVGLAYTELMLSVAIGSIFPFATASPPDGALECDGATYARVDYPDLYAALDAAFIVDADNFVVPDLRGRTILGVGTGSGLSTYAMNDAGGEENHTLTAAELAAHTHGVTDPGHTHTEGIAAPNVTTIGAGAPQPTAIPAVGVTGLALTGVSVNSAGADTPHENRQPFTALRYGIWAI